MREAEAEERDRLAWEEWRWAKRAEEMLTFSEFDVGVCIELLWTQNRRRVGKITAYNPDTQVCHAQ